MRPRAARTTRRVNLLVDADACPNVIKDILFRAATRAQLPLTLVANQPLHFTASPYVRLLQVPPGLDMADRRIIELAEPGDLVITADIPLAAAVVKKGALALNPRGELYTGQNIGERLAMRNLLDELRSGGLASGGPPVLHARDRQAFAAQLDKVLARHKGAATATPP